ncbi:MAG: nucleotidyltransferase domain-containing protein [Chloroflexi bacterium]|nr:MAG: nucleotidyltransferase domain-containing protein [Chloroflexota bacterium]
MQKRRTQLEAKFGRAWQVAEQGAALLKSEFGAERVAVFGSLLAPNLFHHRSDVDLAVWGLPEDDYFRAVGRLQSLDGQISVDLVVVEMASPRLQKKIAHEGKLL